MMKEAAEKVLSPYVPILLSCIVDAWDQSLRVQFRHTYEPRTKSGIVRDLIVANVKEKFSSVPGAKIVQIKNLFFLGIGKYLIRFKKLDTNRLPSNYPTPQAVAIEKQQLEIPETDGRVFLNAGYMVDAIGTRIISAFLTCQIGKTNIWEMMLGGPEQGFVVLPVQQSFGDEIVIRPKKELVDKETEYESPQNKP